MWLLNTDTLKLEAFFNNTPSYAILSHRWEAGQELGFGDVLKTLQHLRGYWKVKEFCAIAQTAGLRYVWADTCCIDQKSSAELSEAINSMFRWYRNADVCYAYLHEIESKEDLGGSTWFSRGWTLQELLAPRKVLFFGHNWIPLGSREHLTSTLERITGIPEDAISNFSYTSYCVAEKMSWSAGRNTTREEDRAYCLLGLFNVNMPLLYGEGPRAYQRLQEEIMKVSTDMSLFLWRGRRSDDSGMLAADTACFSRSSPLLKRSTHTSTAFELVTGWNLNNAGMSVHAKIYPYALADDRSHIFALILNDRSGLGGVYDVFVIFLRKCNTLYGEPTYQRVTVNGSSWNSFGLLLGPCSIDGSPTASLEIIHDCESDHIPFHDKTSGSSIYCQRPTRLFITRQSLIDLKVGDTSRVYVSFISSTAVQYVAGSRPNDGSHSHPHSWQTVSEVYDKGDTCSFDVHSRLPAGLFVRLVITPADNMDIVIYLGFDLDFEFTCIIIPFCTPGTDDIRNIRLAQARHEEEMREWRGAHQSFDERMQAVYGRGHREKLNVSTDFGLSVQALYINGDHEIFINFKVEQFVQHYLPSFDREFVDLQTDLSAAEKEEMNLVAHEIHKKRCRGRLGCVVSSDMNP